MGSTDFWQPLFGVFYSDWFGALLHYLFIASPVWLPIALGIGFWNIWIVYIRSDFIAKQKYVLLELKFPPEVFKSPLAMELVLSNLHQTGGEGSWYAKYIDGKMRPWYSIEIVSFEGNIHFYFWTRASFKNLVEAQFYGQYPNIEINEVEDYTDMMPHYNKKKFLVWCNNFGLTKPDPYPIKTYVDYGLDKDPKEEFKIDPFSHLLEYLSTLQKGEYAWYQIVFTAHKKKHKHGTWFGETTLEEEGKALITELRAKMLAQTKTQGDKQVEFERIPTKGEADLFAAIERSVSKIAFDVGIRLIYFAEPEKFNGGRIATLLTLMKQYNSTNLNGFTVNHVADPFDYPWQDFRDIRKDKIKHHAVDAYRRRMFFYNPHKEHPIILNTEEMATIFHPIGSTLQTPMINRVTSRRADAPTNLPH
jgi:hypothetical protein